jgi:YD repeat-containing protein
MWRYGYDTLHRLVHADAREHGQTPTKLAYDALGRLRRLTVGNNAWTPLHAGGTLLEVRRNRVLDTQVVHVGARPYHVATRGEDYVPVSDLAGDVVAWVDAAGQVMGERRYDAFGAVLDATLDAGDAAEDLPTLVDLGTPLWIDMYAAPPIPGPFSVRATQAVNPMAAPFATLSDGSVAYLPGEGMQLVPTDTVFADRSAVRAVSM